VNHYPRHIGDYLKKTLGLTMLQDGAYNRALDWYYAQERPLPPKPAVYGELRCMTRVDREAVDVVLARYFTEDPDGYRHGRCDEEIERYANRAESARNNGRNGGRPRNRTGTESDTEQEPSRFVEKTESGTESKTNQNQNQNQNQKNPEDGRALSEHRPARARGLALSPTWTVPDELATWAMSERRWTREKVDRVAAEFRDYWLATGTVRKDWNATWRLWVRRERDLGNGGNNAKHSHREQFGTTLWEGKSDARPSEHDITSEAKRVA